MEECREPGADATLVAAAWAIQAGPRIKTEWENWAHASSLIRLSSVKPAKSNGSAAQMQRVWFPAMAQGASDWARRLQRGPCPSGMCLLIWHPS